MKINIKRLHPNAKLPEFAHPGEDACADLYCTEDVVLTPGVPTVVSLGFSMEVPPGWEAQIRPRSGLAAKHGIQVVNTPGTIDSGYRGTVAVILLWGGYASNGWLCNLKRDEGDGDPWWPATEGRVPCAKCKPALRFESGSRIAQLAIRQAPAVEYEWAEELADSARQGGGIGSTGLGARE